MGCGTSTHRSEDHDRTTGFEDDDDEDTLSSIVFTDDEESDDEGDPLCSRSEGAVPDVEQGSSHGTTASRGSTGVASCQDGDVELAINDSESILLQDAMGDPVTIVFSFLQPRGQAHLRGTCSAAAALFDRAADFWAVPMAATTYVPTWSMKRWRWLPVDPRLRGRRPIDGGVDFRYRDVTTYPSRNYRPQLETLQVKQWHEENTSNIFAAVGNGAVRHLQISNVALSRIPDNFLLGCSTLESFTIAHECSVRRIGVGFLAGCQKLREIDMRPVVQEQPPGHGFLSNCTSLQRIVVGTHLWMVLTHDPDQPKAVKRNLVVDTNK